MAHTFYLILLVCLAVAGQTAAGRKRKNKPKWDDYTAAVKNDSDNNCGKFYTLCEKECSPDERYKARCLQVSTKAGKKIKSTLCHCKKGGGRAAEEKERKQNFDSDFLNAHNRYRSLYEAPALELDATGKLGAYALSLARKWAGRPNGHTANKQYGENVFNTNDTSFPDIYEVVDFWYSYIEYYPDFDNPHMVEGPQFTSAIQIVWKGTKHVACETAQRKIGGWVVVCAYDESWSHAKLKENVIPRKNISVKDVVPSKKT